MQHRRTNACPMPGQMTGSKGSSQPGISELLTMIAHFSGRKRTRIPTMGMLSLFAFLAMIGWGDKLFGWNDASGDIQLALGLCFILGAVAGYKVRD